MKKIIIKVYGCVQGVGFRAATRKAAIKLGLTGYVKNLSDGSVYIEAEGPEDRLLELLEFSKKGPNHASVQNVEYDFERATNQFEGFDYE